MADHSPQRFERQGAMLLAGLRRHHEFQSVHTTIARQWAEFRALGPLPGRLGSAAYGAICGSTHTGFEYLSGVEVGSLDSLPSQCGRMRVPVQNYAVFIYEGHVAGLEQCWAGVMEWLAHSDYVSAHTPDFERYDADFDALSASGRIEIWVGVVAKAAHDESASAQSTAQR